jgi:hypothetical protein
MAKKASLPKGAVGKKQKGAAKRAIVKPAVARALVSDLGTTSPDTVIPIPPTNTFNQGLHSATEAIMLQIFGVPGAKTKNCSPVTGSFKQRIVTSSVGPFRVSGLDTAVTSLKAVLDEADQQIPNVVSVLKTAGMLCVRLKRGSNTSFSNHSWGTAVDLYFDSDVIPMGTPKTYYGCLQLAPFFNKHGWYWGAGFSGSSVDSMHFELAQETISAGHTSG